jgi:hypothetical protein
VAGVARIEVDDEGILVGRRDEAVLDVLFDGRRIWSFWLLRDGTRRDDGQFVAWPRPLRRFLHGTTTLAVVEHVSGAVLFEEEVRLGSGQDRRIAVVNAEGKPLGLDKSNRLAQTFDTRSEEHVAPLLDSIEEVLGALKAAGVDAFPAYGTLLGAVRGGRLIGHDSDADLGYVSEHEHPVDVVRESFRLQRRLSEMGYAITRYSGAAFKVDVVEADGSVRGLDVFGGFLHGGDLVLMGEIRTPFRREWIFPLGTTTLEGRTLPAPADTDRFLAATYGPSWRVPDPAYVFETPRSTHRRLNGWFRGTRTRRPEWDRVWSAAHRRGMPPTDGTAFARWVRAREPDATQVVDIGCGRGTDAWWFAGEGVPSLGLDYAPRAFQVLAERAATEPDRPVGFRTFNLLELRQVLATGALLARQPEGRRVLYGRHIADATDSFGRGNLWRFAQMALSGGGRLHLEFLAPSATQGGRFARRKLLRPLRPDLVIGELEGRGATIVEREDVGVRRPGAPAPDGYDEDEYEPDDTFEGRRICRLVVEWQA